MAKRLNVKLQGFKLTKKPTSGKTSHHLIARGFKPEKTGNILGDSSNCETEIETVETHFFHGDVQEQLPTLHEISQKQSCESWKKIRSKLLKVVIESEAMPENQHCLMCSVEIATYRCKQCTPGMYYCATCFQAAHSRANFFHGAEIWKVCYTYLFVLIHHLVCSCGVIYEYMDKIFSKEQFLRIYNYKFCSAITSNID